MLLTIIPVFHHSILPFNLPSFSSLHTKRSCYMRFGFGKRKPDGKFRVCGPVRSIRDLAPLLLMIRLPMIFQTMHTSRRLSLQLVEPAHLLIGESPISPCLSLSPFKSLSFIGRMNNPLMGKGTSLVLAAIPVRLVSFVIGCGIMSPRHV